MDITNDREFQRFVENMSRPYKIGNSKKYITIEHKRLGRRIFRPSATHTLKSFTSQGWKIVKP